MIRHFRYIDVFRYTAIYDATHYFTAAIIDTPHCLSLILADADADISYFRRAMPHCVMLLRFRLFIFRDTAIYARWCQRYRAHAAARYCLMLYATPLCYAHVLLTRSDMRSAARCCAVKKSFLSFFMPFVSLIFAIRRHFMIFIIDFHYDYFRLLIFFMLLYAAAYFHTRHIIFTCRYYDDDTHYCSNAIIHTLLILRHDAVLAIFFADTSFRYAISQMINIFRFATRCRYVFAAMLSAFHIIYLRLPFSFLAEDCRLSAAFLHISPPMFFIIFHDAADAAASLSPVEYLPPYIRYIRLLRHYFRRLFSLLPAFSLYDIITHFHTLLLRLLLALRLRRYIVFRQYFHYAITLTIIFTPLSPLPVLFAASLPVSFT